MATSGPSTPNTARPASRWRSPATALSDVVALPQRIEDQCGHWLALDRRGDRGSGYRGMMR
jgi:hypothetical protein